TGHTANAVRDGLKQLSVGAIANRLRQQVCRGNPFAFLQRDSRLIHPTVTRPLRSVARRTVDAESLATSWKKFVVLKQSLWQTGCESDRRRGPRSILRDVAQ